jgi:hypothetical protein
MTFGKRFVFCAATALAMFVAVTHRADADSARLNVTAYNDIDKPAWITYYESSGFDPVWHIEKAICVMPGQNHTYRWSLDRGEIKVRAEVKSGPECHGNTLSDTYDQRKYVPNNLHAHVVKHGAGYHVWF